MCKRQLIELSAQAHTEGAYRFAADMQLEQEIIKIWGRLIMEGQNLDLTEYFLPVAIICLNGPFRLLATSSSQPDLSRIRPY